jgi:hypothetical protein
MNNNTQIETVEEAANRILYKNRHKKTTVDSMRELVEWSKQQDEAKLLSLTAEMESWKKENFENLESANETILSWEAKYKELLESHNELLEVLQNVRPLMQPREYCKGIDYLKLDNEIGKTIMKGKNINKQN